MVFFVDLCECYKLVGELNLECAVYHVLKKSGVEFFSFTIGGVSVEFEFEFGENKVVIGRQIGSSVDPGILERRSAACCNRYDHFVFSCVITKLMCVSGSYLLLYHSTSITSSLPALSPATLALKSP